MRTWMPSTCCCRFCASGKAIVTDSIPKSSFFNQLACDLEVDMRQWWRPDVSVPQAPHQSPTA